MIYKFRSKAAGDLIMLGPHGDQLLRLLGREPAPKGIIEPAQMPAAVAALQAAVQAAGVEPAGDGDEAAADDEAPRDRVQLHQRLWPMIEMLRRAADAGEPIVWGV
jgi:hypothetical protein